MCVCVRVFCVCMCARALCVWFNFRAHDGNSTIVSWTGLGQSLKWVLKWDFFVDKKSKIFLKLIKYLIKLFMFYLKLFFFRTQNHLLSYCNQFRVTFLFQLMIKPIYLIFVDTLLILNKILLILILKKKIASMIDIIYFKIKQWL